MISSNATWIKICISKQFKKKLDDSYVMVCEKQAMRGICRRLTKQEFVRELIDYGFSYISKKYKLDEDDEPRIMPNKQYQPIKTVDIDVDKLIGEDF